MTLFPFIGCALVLILASACHSGQRSSAAITECWADETSLSYLRREAYQTFLARRQRDADSLRRLVSVPIQPDSLVAHSEVVRDPELCHRAAHGAEAPQPGERFTVLRVGRTYWVRSSRGVIMALDHNFRHIMSIVELN